MSAGNSSPLRYTGMRIKRLEDPRLLSGRGRYLDDLALPRMLFASFVRSPHAHTRIVRIPYTLFWIMLSVYALFDRDPPFTTKQLEALVTPDVFEVIDWPGIFGVKATPLQTALAETYRHPTYSQIVLEF